MKKIITLLSLVLITLQGFSQIKVGRTVMDYQVEYGGETLVMNGAGTRSMLFIELYSAALYLKDKKSDAIGIAYDDETMAIKIEITSKLISRETMMNAIEDGFQKATDNNTSSLDSRIAKIREFYLQELVVGDKLDLVYVKGEGVNCYMNNKKLGVIEGQDFKFALYKIWFGEDPASKSLKEAMLGRS